MFQLAGAFDNQTDTNFRAIDSNWSIFGIARDLGAIQSTQDPIVWSTGFITDPAINYTDPSGASQQRSLFYRSQYPQSDDTSLVSIPVQHQLMCLISYHRSLISSMISPTPLHELSNWT